MFSLSNMLIPAILFFALGFLAQLVRSDLKFPTDLAKALSIYLLVGIGLHRGMELAEIDAIDAIGAIVAALGLGFGLPVVAYLILSHIVPIDRLNAAAIAAHYGSVSAGTFVTAIAFLDSLALASAQQGSIPATPSTHRLQRGLPGYLIPFAPHAFAPQRQFQSSEPPSPLVFLPISTHFTATLGIPLTSPGLKLFSLAGISSVEPRDFTYHLKGRLRALYAQ